VRDVKPRGHGPGSRWQLNLIVWQVE